MSKKTPALVTVRFGTAVPRHIRPSPRKPGSVPPQRYSRFRPSPRPDAVSESAVLRAGDSRTLATTSPRADISDRDRQYYAIHKTRLRLLFAAAPMCHSIRALGRALGIPQNIVGYYLAGRRMPSLGVGLALAYHLAMEPGVLYAWLWERQQERAFWFPEERPVRKPLTYHPRPLVSFTTTPDRSPSLPCAPATPAPAVARKPSLCMNTVSPGACDWRNYSPETDPVYLRVMRELASGRRSVAPSRVVPTPARSARSGQR